jgi:hypothetical protein
MNLIDLDFNYNGVECDYNYHYDCESNGCDEEGICRCGTIHDEYVTNVNLGKIVNIIYNQIFDNSNATKRDNTINQILYGIGKEINIYTIDRILRKYKIWQPDLYDIEVEGGYYGQEIGSIRLVSNIATKIMDDINEALSIDTLKGRIEFLLYLEYGNILPELVNCEYELLSVNKSDIIFGSLSHHKKVKVKDLNFYEDVNYNGIRGIILEKDNKYRLIDGYHRIHITKGHKVNVLVAKKSLD